MTDYLTSDYDEPRGLDRATGELVPVPIRGNLIEAAPVGDVVAVMHQYQDLCQALLDESDFQTEWNGRKFKKKSAFRKLAVAFNVSIDRVLYQVDRDDRGRIQRATVTVVATAPNGRHMIGTGVCDVNERCCEAAFGDPCDIRAAKHQHCADGCSGRRHFTHPEHDLPGTAETRATNRASADLFGMGEVSAEEVSDRAAGGQPEPVWQPAAAFAALVETLPPAVVEALRNWRQMQGLPPVSQLTPEQGITVAVKIGELCTALKDVAATPGAPLSPQEAETPQPPTDGVYGAAGEHTGPGEHVREVVSLDDAIAAATPRLSLEDEVRAMVARMNAGDVDQKMDEMGFERDARAATLKARREDLAQAMIEEREAVDAEAEAD